MRRRGLIALGALCSLTIAVGAASVTHAGRGGTTNSAGSAAAGPASPLWAGPVTSLPASPVAVAQGSPTSIGEATLWVLGEDAVWAVTIAASGTGTVTSTTPLAPGADPVAIACIRPVEGDPGLWRGCGDPAHSVATPATVYVLDRASEAMLVFEPGQDGSLAQTASLAVGSSPSAFALADLNAHIVGPDTGPDGEDVPALVDIAVTNEGSDDVSILLARADGSYAPQRRVAVGARPRDVVAGYLDGGGIDLAVAASGANSVSILRGNGRGSFARADVAVTGTPTALLAGPPGGGWLELDGESWGELLVADAEGTVSVFRGRDRGVPRLAARVSLPAGATSEAVALRVSTGLDERPHLLVADRGAGEVLDVPIGYTGTLGAPSSVLSGVQPVALDIGYFLTASHADSVVVADGSGALRLLVTSPSRLVERRQGAANVAAGDGLVVWSQSVGSDRHQLRIADPSGVRYLPASTSHRPLVPRVGRAADGTPVVTYRRCRERRCRPWVWSVAGGSARRLHVAAPRGCAVRDLAMWDGVLAFVRVSRRTGRCRPGERGLWVRASARTYRISRRATRLGDLREQRVSWFEGDSVFGHLRVSSLHGRPRTVVGWTADGRELELGLLSGEFVHWLEPSFRADSPSSTLRRASVTARGPRCEFLPPEETFDDPGFHLGRRTIAIDGTEVVYIDHHGVFATAPEPSRWRPCR